MYTDNGIGVKGITAISEAMKTNSVLTLLNINSEIKKCNDEIIIEWNVFEQEMK